MCEFVDANQMYTKCQSSTVASYLTVCKNLRKQVKVKKYYFEIEMVSRDDVSAKSAETRIL